MTNTATQILELAHAKQLEAELALTTTPPTRHQPSAPLADRVAENLAARRADARLMAELTPWLDLAAELVVDDEPIGDITDEQAEYVIEVALRHGQRAAHVATEPIPDPVDPRDVAETVAALHRRASAARFVDALADLGIEIGYRLTAAQAAARVGVGVGTWRAYVSREDAQVPAPVESDEGPRWLSHRVDRWNASRPGRGRWGTDGRRATKD
jgi:hypothetical protein